MIRSINPKSLLVATSLLVLSTSVNAGILYRIAGVSAGISSYSQITSFANLAGGIQHFDYDVSGTISGANTGLWAAGTNTVTDSTGAYTHTFAGTITGLTAVDADLAFVTLDDGNIYRIAGVSAGLSSYSQITSFANLAGGIQHFDYDVSGTTFGANTGLWAAGTNTVTDSTGAYTHTFAGTITGLTAVDADLAFVTLDDGNIYRIAGVSASLSSLSQNASFANLAGGIQHFDYDVSGTISGANTGLWAAGTNTVTNNLGTYSHTFAGTIIGLSAVDDDLAFVLVSSPSAVPVPAAVWLMGSALMGLFGFQRKKAGQEISNTTA